MGPVYDKGIESWRILKYNEVYAMVKKPTIAETIKRNRLRWFAHVQRMEQNRIPKKVLGMNLETTRLRSRTRNRWQDELRKDGRLVGGIEWRKIVQNRAKWKKLLRTVREDRILHLPMEEWLFKSRNMLLIIIGTVD